MINGIGEKSIEAMKLQLNDLIEIHNRKIQEAYYQAHDRKLKVGISIAIAEISGRLAVESTITYTVEKISDKRSCFIEENQVQMFPVNTNGINKELVN